MANEIWRAIWLRWLDLGRGRPPPLPPPLDNPQALAVGSSDFKCRVYSGFIDDQESGEKQSFFGIADKEFGEVMGEFSANGWVEALAWSPNG